MAADLRLVHAQPEPWARGEDEPEGEWWAFWAWIGARYAYGASDPPSDADVAKRNLWAERASKLFAKIAPDSAVRSNAWVRDQFGELRDLGLIRLKQAVKDDRIMLDVRDIVTLLNVYQQISGSGSTEEIDIDRLQLDEARTLRELLAKVRRAA